MTARSSNAGSARTRAWPPAPRSRPPTCAAGPRALPSIQLGAGATDRVRLDRLRGGLRDHHHRPRGAGPRRRPPRDRGYRCNGPRLRCRRTPRSLAMIGAAYAPLKLEMNPVGCSAPGLDQQWRLEPGHRDPRRTHRHPLELAGRLRISARPISPDPSPLIASPSSVTGNRCVITVRRRPATVNRPAVCSKRLPISRNLGRDRSAPTVQGPNRGSGRRSEEKLETAHQMCSCYAGRWPRSLRGGSNAAAGGRPSPASDSGNTAGSGESQDSARRQRILAAEPRDRLRLRGPAARVREFRIPCLPGVLPGGAAVQPGRVSGVPAGPRRPAATGPGAARLPRERLPLSGERAKRRNPGPHLDDVVEDDVVDLLVVVAGTSFRFPFRHRRDNIAIT